MPGLLDGVHNSKKRKKDASERKPQSSKRRAVADDNEDKNRIQQLEDQIAESRKYYNNIVTLISLFITEDSTKSPNLTVALSLCRVFCRLLAGGQFNKPKGASEQDLILVAWLKERYQEYQQGLINVLKKAEPTAQIAALSLCMRLIKEQSINGGAGADVGVWKGGYFNDLVIALIEAQDGERVRSEFIENFLTKYHDVAFYTLLRLSDFASTNKSPESIEVVISLLSALGQPPPPNHEFESFYTDLSSVGQKHKATLLSVSSYKQRVQAAWLSVLRSNTLNEQQRKTLLRLMSRLIAPWFLKPEMLMDFLTDSYDQGGSTSLLALSGLFYLIQEKNLDYPQFYQKLYSLLDADLLHSKHRSRFFRLLDTFLSSSHLPATLVASFIKRLSRLALNAPPAAIVVIVPWIYNLLKSHPTCTFMLHRVIRDEASQSKLQSHGMTDPFDPTEPDPTRTGALESSLWEIETLQSHYHPNVASLSKIISEQFTKQAYNLEDFLDHSYQGMVGMELGKEEKEFRKAPVVEFQIPKRIFTDRLLEEDGGVDKEVGALVRGLWDFT
ncbi:ribosome biogenesis protein Noc4 [Blastomyces dermatitidis ATCC 18188]|uniref:Ribosome biogenesis protein Noc4 n=1 Tax=Ajellomyces dermatitidis (strain ATCC 18188 / CBS 674.68) TaxID=653446 RepID=F2TMK5_AJEDA|nr:ribosome biogenesis protein Noc4 [Blastomyces dermatitidis ATCC 18188]